VYLIACTWTNKLEDCAALGGVCGEPARRDPAWLIGEGMARHSIMASSSVGRGEPVLASRGLKSYACNVVFVGGGGGSGLPRAMLAGGDLAWRPGKTAA
jgi:hypothetical protein